MSVVITFGTFDLLHIGHVSIINNAAQLGDTLVVGISSDEFTVQKKHKFPVYSQEERMLIVRSLKNVTTVFLEESMDLKAEYIRKYNADILVMGSDWAGKFDYLAGECGIQVIYLPRTQNISTTEIIGRIRAT